MTNTKGETVYLSATPFQSAPGSVTYQNITLPSGAQPLGDPPQAIRDVALPSRKNKPSKRLKIEILISRPHQPHCPAT
jgi:hypothetical protein